MQLTYDAGADVTHIQLADAPVARSKEVSPGIVHKFDAAGRLLAITVHKATKNRAAGTLVDY